MHTAGVENSTEIPNPTWTASVEAQRNLVARREANDQMATHLQRFELQDLHTVCIAFAVQ